MSTITFTYEIFGFSLGGIQILINTKGDGCLKISKNVLRYLFSSARNVTRCWGWLIFYVIYKWLLITLIIRLSKMPINKILCIFVHPSPSLILPELPCTHNTCIDPPPPPFPALNTLCNSSYNVLNDLHFSQIICFHIVKKNEITGKNNIRSWICYVL